MASLEAPSQGGYTLEYDDIANGQAHKLSGLTKDRAQQLFLEKSNDTQLGNVRYYRTEPLSAAAVNSHSYSAVSPDSKSDAKGDNLGMGLQLDKDAAKVDDSWKQGVLTELESLKADLEKVELGKKNKHSHFKPVAANVITLADTAITLAKSSSATHVEIGKAVLELESEIAKLKVNDKSAQAKKDFKTYCDHLLSLIPPFPRGDVSSPKIRFADADDGFGETYIALKENFFHANKDKALAVARDIDNHFQQHATKDGAYLIFGGSTALCALGYEVGPGDFDVYTNDTKALQAAMRDAGYGDIKLNQAKRYVVGADNLPALELPGSMVSGKELALKNKGKQGPEVDAQQQGGLLIPSTQYLLNQYTTHARDKDAGKIEFLKSLPK